MSRPTRTPPPQAPAPRATNQPAHAQPRARPAAPPVYSPNPAPRVLQPKAALPRPPAQRPPAAPPRVTPAVAARPAPPVAVARRVVQRMEQPPKPGTGSSGRKASQLWTHFCNYKNAQSKIIEDAFRDAGYDITNIQKTLEGAITELGLDLPAHGTGGTDSGTQGNLDEVAVQWVSKLTTWAAQHPKGSNNNNNSGLKHSETKQQEIYEQKQTGKTERKQKRQEHYEMSKCPNAPRYPYSHVWDHYDKYCIHCKLRK